MVDLGFETVHTVDDWYDGPRQGVADYEGAPHFYRSLALDLPAWSSAEDRFQLTPVSEADLALVLEDWAIWRRWEDAFEDGLATQASHPALPEDRTRHEEIAALLSDRLRIDPARCVVAHAEFRPRAVPAEIRVGRPRPLEVRWTLAPLPG
jgi:hypothetical protein